MSAWRAILTIGLAGLFFYIVGRPMFLTPQTIYTGVTLRQSAAPIAPNVVDVAAGSPAYKAGIRTGDTLSCMSRRDYTLLFATGIVGLGTRAAYVPGTVIHLCDTRAGVVRRIAFTGAVLAPSPMAYGNFPLTVLRLAEYAVFLVCGIALVLARPSVTTWIFYAFCLSSMPDYLLLVNGTTDSAAGYFARMFAPFVLERCGTALLLLFALYVPQERVFGWRRSGVMATWIAIAAFAGFFAYSAIANVAVSPQFVTGSLSLFAAATILVVLARLFGMERDERGRFGWAAFAIVWGVVSNALHGFGGSVNIDVTIVAGNLTVVMPLALTYAILRRHVIDVRFVISRGVVYALITTLVVGLIGVVDWATSAYLHEARAAMALDAAVTIALGFVLHRTYGWVENVVDLLLFREKHEANAYLQRVARTLPFAERDGAIDRALVHDPYEKLELSAAALFRANAGRFVPVEAEGWHATQAPSFDRDDDLVRFLLAERTRLFIGDLRTYVAQPFHALGAAPVVAIPVFSGNRLIAFALYGLHRDGTRLDPDEVAVLEHLCESAAQAYVAVELARYEAAASRSIPAMEAL